MAPFSAQSRTSQRGGFSLIEVVIAIGVASFAIVAILGLLSVSFATEKASADDTEMAIAATSLLNELRNRPFDDMLVFLDSDLSQSVPIGDDGSRVSDPAEARFIATYRSTVDTDTMVAGGPANLVRVGLQMTVAHAAAIPGNTKVFHASLARH